MKALTVTAANQLVWIDLETTGLDGLQNDETMGCQKHLILSLAVIVTDHELNQVDEGIELIIHHDKSAIDAVIDPWCVETHTKSGLLDQVEISTYSLAQAEKMVIDYLNSRGCQSYNRKEKSGAIMCGNSIKFDRNFLNAQCPDLDSYFHYRQMDVSAVNLMSRLWRPEVADSVQKQSKHTALADIKESLEELRLYKTAFFQKPADAEDEVMIAKSLAESQSILNQCSMKLNKRGKSNVQDM